MIKCVRNTVRLFSFPGSAWERQGWAALPLQERPQAGRACQAGRPRVEPGHEGKRWCYYIYYEYSHNRFSDKSSGRSLALGGVRCEYLCGENTNF
jgi:hypothetical protein